MRVIDDVLEAQSWVPQAGVNINPVPAEAFEGVELPTGPLKVTNVSTSALGGALVTCKRPVPQIGGSQLAHLGLDLEIYVSSFDLPLLGRLEIDVKVALTAPPTSETDIPNIANFSSQLNLSTGEWQIDGNPPGWLDTGFKPVIVPDVWIAVSFRYFIDYKSSKFSVLSALFGAETFVVPASMQEVALQSSNWQPTAAIQLQTETIEPGGVTTLYKGITLTWSDKAF